MMAIWLMIFYISMIMIFITLMGTFIIPAFVFYYWLKEKKLKYINIFVYFFYTILMGYFTWKSFIKIFSSTNMNTTSFGLFVISLLCLNFIPGLLIKLIELYQNKLKG